MTYIVEKNNTSLTGIIDLPTSKSISNRLLIIRALTQDGFPIHNISISKDTELMLAAFESTADDINIGHAGTTMRFLTAYHVAKNKERKIFGSERMHNRPIAKLVDALRQLNADVTYLEKEGFPPLHIKPTELQGNKVEIDGSVSSQYITALLMVAPELPNGLNLIIKNRLVSQAYVKLTLSLMEYLGVKHTWNDNVITIEKQQYSPKEMTVEADWSGASYWYEMAALCDNVDITIKGLQSDSLQGDSVIANIYTQFGVHSKFENNTVKLTKHNVSCAYFDFDFSDCPDLVQTVVPTCVIKKIPFKITGAETLRIKETDRIAALQTELAKLGANIKETKPGTLIWSGNDEINIPDNVAFDTYDDHRMALAFAPLAIASKIKINEPNVVVKSYPNFWEHLKQVGFTIDNL
ncbi:3-phosphoshikimate 1-carboxyvinyltransferase [Bacteroidales bacterium]|nr:3-phosphoshikimate 1-carboxyvinyltransferase [Bacteroidales bacterium]